MNFARFSPPSMPLLRLRCGFGAPCRPTQRIGSSALPMRPGRSASCRPPSARARRFDPRAMKASGPRTPSSFTTPAERSGSMDGRMTPPPPLASLPGRQPKRSGRRSRRAGVATGFRESIFTVPAWRSLDFEPTPWSVESESVTPLAATSPVYRQQRLPTGRRRWPSRCRKVDTHSLDV